MVLLFSELNEASPSLASLSDLVNFSTKFYNSEVMIFVSLGPYMFATRILFKEVSVFNFWSLEN